jgi:hypothetical protein
VKPLSFELPGMKLVNPTNEHKPWQVRHARAQKQRHAARVATQAYALGAKPPLVVTITRRGPGKLDSDSLPPSGKHARDGIADALGVDDGDESLVQWRYAQERAREWSVLVTIEAAASSVLQSDPSSRGLTTGTTGQVQRAEPHAEADGAGLHVASGAGGSRGSSRSGHTRRCAKHEQK